MQPFLSHDTAVQTIVKGLSLTQNLYVSSILIGEPHTGKQSLLHSLFPHAPIVSANHEEQLYNILPQVDELIVTDFEKLTNHTQLDFTNKRILATANYIGNERIIDELFAFIYTMPSLKERPKDIPHLTQQFTQEALSTLVVEEDQINPESFTLDISQNTKTLKRSIYQSVIQQTMQTKEIEETLYCYLLKHLEGNDAYKHFLGLYERPLIKAGLAKYGSQLKLSDILGINRNTLRKKKEEYQIDTL
jgi:DNA-binding protein Fis